jgi:hypothetical protein
LHELIREYQGIAYRIFFCAKDQEIWLLHAMRRRGERRRRLTWIWLMIGCGTS